MVRDEVSTTFVGGLQVICYGKTIAAIITDIEAFEKLIDPDTQEILDENNKLKTRWLEEHEIAAKIEAQNKKLKESLKKWCQ